VSLLKNVKMWLSKVLILSDFIEFSNSFVGFFRKLKFDNFSEKETNKKN